MYSLLLLFRKNVCRNQRYALTRSDTVVFMQPDFLRSQTAGDETDLRVVFQKNMREFTLDTHFRL